ncbi:F0F1 ATP synthase subunit gamma [Helicobacter enhydrae]|uniref:ATP synthase gamma chain n=1 Tax=Helicobacter enhydrae TaxID=222136 RepID=A0A1B1U6U1_9HELI|nr:ATP synthase F1 subunit gamma [Helicobacter enhydrae]ANV98456.1 F0F1 ATP synthase subunit gamma [Helicobacter enhydrae]
MGNNLKEIRRKISSVQNTQKTTRAMKLVSASKLKKAEELAKASKAFAKKIDEVFGEIVQKVALVGFENLDNAIFQASKPRDVKTIDVIFVTSDKGLCGGFNQATIKEVSAMIRRYQQDGIQVRLRGIGKKGISFFQFNEVALLDEMEDLSSTPDYEKAAKFIKRSVDDFVSEATDGLVIVHNGFKTMISQEIKVQTLLPLKVEEYAKEGEAISNMEIEPDESASQILEELSYKYLEYTLYYALLDSLVAEHSARVQAMEAATNNAGNLVRSLTVAYNKARQEAITTELVEINAGVEAMK